LHSNALTCRHVLHTWRWGALGRATRPTPRDRRRMALERTRAVVQHQRRRTSIDAYGPRRSDPDYVFFTAWPWAKHSEVNPPRIEFIEACRRAKGLTFEGGFAPRRRSDVPEVRTMSARARYPIRDYIAKLGRSAVAFNNPAVHGCLGWKLGEFLALGKATISLPITRVLPAPLEPGVHLHVIDGSPESFDDALETLRRNDDYRRSLEINARQWYEQHLAPTRLAQRLLDLLDS
jgi:glycosyltransferase involved in cell wall biosynthesis